jgi:hypothetical protein
LLSGAVGMFFTEVTRLIHVLTAHISHVFNWQLLLSTDTPTNGIHIPRIERIFAVPIFT